MIPVTWVCLRFWHPKVCWFIIIFIIFPLKKAILWVNQVKSPFSDTSFAQKSWPGWSGLPRKILFLGNFLASKSEYRKTVNLIDPNMIHGQWEISRILKWRYVSTIFQAKFCGDIPLHRPYIGLIYGRYLQFRILKWPLTCSMVRRLKPPESLRATTFAPWSRSLTECGDRSFLYWNPWLGDPSFQETPLWAWSSCDPSHGWLGTVS